MTQVDERFNGCVQAIDAANRADPVLREFEGATYPQSLLEGERAQAWIERLLPDASETLRLAARAHHVRRWEVPRSSYPRTREGYHAWRTYLYGFHAEVLAGFMETAGYPPTEVDRARTILSKRVIKSDPDAQTHEDAVSLAFLEVRLAEFAPTITDEQLLRALRRTWAKMSPAGRAAAQSLALNPQAQAALAAALG
ncbi:MAG: DUF4202 domain-containing protein [Chloroflexota bacterium]